MAIPLLGLASCVSPLQAPSAFAGERFLCAEDDQADFSSLLADCREQSDPLRKCAGYASLRGIVDQQPVVVDAPANESKYVDKPSIDAQTTRDLFFSALSPYFKFTIHMNFVLDPSTGSMTNRMDGVNSDSLNLEARGGNYYGIMLAETRDLQTATPDEVGVAFSANTSRGGSIEGCFHVFPQPLK